MIYLSGEGEEKELGVVLKVKVPYDQIKPHVSSDFHKPASAKKDVPPANAQQVPDIVPEQVPDLLAEHVPDCLPKEVPDCLAEQDPDLLAQQVSDYLAEQDPLILPEQVPDSLRKQIRPTRHKLVPSDELRIIKTQRKVRKRPNGPLPLTPAIPYQPSFQK